MEQLCIYHKNCADGFGAAFAVWLAHNDTEFVAASYGDVAHDVTGRDVVMVDFSYNRDTLIGMSKKANSILILDHHKSAQQELIDLPENIKPVFCMEKSGAVLAWEYFHQSPVPELFQYIQDRDLWTKKLDGVDEVASSVFARPYEFKDWQELLQIPINDLKREGQVLLMDRSKNIAALIDSALHRTIIAGFDVPTVNAPNIWASDIGAILSEREPFSATYWDCGSYRHFSLRSSKEGGIDVSKVASLFGGGGHANAAGFKIELASLLNLQVKLLPAQD